jgi:hypothetical protein
LSPVEEEADEMRLPLVLAGESVDEVFESFHPRRWVVVDADGSGAGAGGHGEDEDGGGEAGESPHFPPKVGR